jgi:hypothetical protein
MGSIACSIYLSLDEMDELECLTLKIVGLIKLGEGGG